MGDSATAVTTVAARTFNQILLVIILHVVEFWIRTGTRL